MKKGKTILELAQALEEIRKNGKDFIVPTKSLMADSVNGELKVKFAEQELVPNNWSHSQLSSYTSIPKMYYDRLKVESPSLLADNINHGLSVCSQKERKDKKPESRMIRTVGNKMRAIVSSSYQRYDSYDLLETVLPMITKNMQVVSSEITDTRLYLKVVSDRLTADIKKGDTVQYGLVISNSDVGAGSVRVEPLIYRLICLNGMISNTAMSKYHVGRNIAGTDVYEILEDNTKKLTEQAFWAQVRDVISNSMQKEVFDLQVDRLRSAAHDKIENFDIPQVVELASKAVGGVQKGLLDNIVGYLANGADGAGLTRWGLSNAFTWAAQQDNVDYDESIELERAGGKIIDLTKKDWKRIALTA